MKEMLKRVFELSFAMALAMCILTGCSKASQTSQPEEEFQEEALEDPYAYEDEEYYDDEYYDYGDEEFIEDEYAEGAAEGAVEEPAEEPAKDDLNKSDSNVTDVTGKWYTEGYDEDTNWAGSYVIELTADGKATCTGWRNKDAGTYKVDGDTVLITFDDCQVDEAGEGFQPVKGFIYTIEMKANGDDVTIKIDAPDIISNLEDGKVHRMGSTDSGASKADNSKSADTDDGSYITDEKYLGELSQDGSEISIETGLSHYDKDWKLIKDYDKQKIVLKTSKDCKCVIMQEDVQTFPISEKVEFINEFLKSNNGLPVGLVIKDGDLVEINFSS